MNCARMKAKITYANNQKLLEYELGLIADPIIEAIPRLEFEDSLRTGVIPGGYWYPYCFEL